MTKKIFRSLLLISLLMIMVSYTIVVGVLYKHFSVLQEKQLEDELSLALLCTEQNNVDALSTLSSNTFRFTHIRSDGTVLFDTQKDALQMDNHKDRTEVKEAFLNGSSKSARYSNTLMHKTMYQAVLLSDGSVLRISSIQSSFPLLLLDMATPVFFLTLLAVLLSIFFSNKLAKRIIAPLNNLKLDEPLENEQAYDELSPLLTRIFKQQEEINAQLYALENQNKKFNQITAHLNEGLVLLDEKTQIVSINPSALHLFKTDKYCIGKDFITINRNARLSTAIDNAQANNHSEIQIELNDRVYQFDISKIQFSGENMGMVMLIFDVTDHVFLERNRKEFTANVSHELKTPLQSIIGSSELLQNNLVKNQDIPVFSERIRKEAQRMVSLIEDIIRLSQLDENTQFPFETVCVKDVLNEVLESLCQEIKHKNLSVTVHMPPLQIYGVKHLLYEILYNVCDNAIKYNVQNGSIFIDGKTEGNFASLSIKDTGVGIPNEHIDRIFERFYRVDKSRSKASGGTGLGLSIVKHAVQTLSGTVQLTSEPLKGTTVLLRFPQSPM